MLKDPPAPTLQWVPLIVRTTAVVSVTVPLTAISSAVVVKPSFGESRAIWGAVLSRVPLRMIVVSFPAPSVAMIVTMFVPSKSGIPADIGAIAVNW